MRVGDRVSITDPQQTHEGTVTTVLDNGMLTVKWDSGMNERVHESEITLLGRTLAPREGDEAYDDAYESDDPKHPSFRERLAALWDSRPGK